MLCRPAFFFGRDFGRTWSCACRGDGDGAGDDVREDEAALDEEAAEPVRDGIGLDCEKPAIGWEGRGIEGAGTGLGELSVAEAGCAAPDARGWLAVDEGDLRLARSRTIGKVGASSTASGTSSAWPQCPQDLRRTRRGVLGPPLRFLFLRSERVWLSVRRRG